MHRQLKDPQLNGCGFFYARKRRLVFGVRASTGQVEDVLQARRAQYMNMVQNLAKTDAATVRSMNLPKPILSDIQLARDLSHLSPENYKRAMLQYEGRGFGEKITNPEQQARGVRERGKVEINTFHSRHTVELVPRQIITGQTTAGAVMKGEVVGVLPEGRVIIKNIYDFRLSEAKPNLNGRVDSAARAAFASLKFLQGCRTKKARHFAGLPLLFRVLHTF